MKKILIAIMMILTMTIGGCKTSPDSCEEKLRNLAKEVTPEQELENLKGGLRLDKLSDRYELVDIQTNKTVYYIKNPEKFYGDEDPYENFDFIDSNQKLSDKHMKAFEKAQKMALSYIDTSNVINEKQKEPLKKVIKNVKIHYGRIKSISNESRDVTIMITKGTDIFLLEGMEEFYKESVFLHELVHVISNETNKGNKSSNDSYRFSGINEGLTELITREILYANGLKPEDNVTYQAYFPYVLSLLSKVDLLKAYYYSDEYDSIFEGINRDWIDTYYMIVSWGTEEDLNAGVPYWVFAQF